MPQQPRPWAQAPMDLGLGARVPSLVQVLTPHSSQALLSQLFPNSTRLPSSQHILLQKNGDNENKQSQMEVERITTFVCTKAQGPWMKINCIKKLLNNVGKLRLLLIRGSQCLWPPCSYTFQAWALCTRKRLVLPCADFSRISNFCSYIWGTGLPEVP